MAQPDGMNASGADSQASPERGSSLHISCPSEGGGAASQASPETVLWNGHGLKMLAQLGRYRLKKRLGGGGMGAVFLVENTKLRRDEALKVPHFDSAGDPAVRERFLREAHAAASLDHPNLCPIYDADAIDGIYFLTMRLLPGKPLSDYVGRTLPPQKAVEIVVRLAKAMEHAHEKGVIHRDLKPSNVMMCPGTGPTIMDFGLARQTVQSETRLTETGKALGTPAYMPPEQVKGELSRIGPASDVYSLGVILFELLTGKLPFVGASGEVLGKVMYGEAPLPSVLHAGLGTAFDALCRKVLAKKPEERFASMKSLAAELLKVRRTLPKSSESMERPEVREKQDIFEVPTVPPEKAPQATQTAQTERPTRSIPPPPKPSWRAKPSVPSDKDTAVGSKRGLGLALALLGGFAATVLLCLGILMLGMGNRKDGDDQDIGMKLVLIRKGTFKMGSPEGVAAHSKDEEQHEVEITEDFYLGVHEVTQKQFKAVMGYNPSYFSKDGAGKDKVPEDTSEFPVERVSWQEAMDFCAKLTERERKAGKISGKQKYSLPSEAQWEYACRGGPRSSSKPFHFKSPSDFIGARQANFNTQYPYGDGEKGEPLGRTNTVGKNGEANALGLFDMHGNVEEWCSDWYDKDYYGKNPVKDPAGPSKGVFRVIRGGGWDDFGTFCRSADRLYVPPVNRYYGVGFRAARVSSDK